MLSLWQYQRKYYFIILQTSQPCEAGLFPFSQEGDVTANTALCLRWLPAGAFTSADSAQAYPYSSSRKRLKIGGTQKSSSEATWIFCMEPICFGIIKGEQPLVCNGDDRGQRPKQGGAVGAAACRMRVPRKARSRRREPQPAASRASKVAETLPR